MTRSGHWLRSGALIVGLIGCLLPFPIHGQWVEPPGVGWVELRVSHHDTREEFDKDGDSVPFESEGARAMTTTLRLTGAVGFRPGLDVWFDAPFHRLEFNNAQGDRLSAGPGDPRLFLRAEPTLVGIDDLPVALALRGGVKFPLGDFEVDAEVIPLSEGQRDWEMLLEVGKSLHPWPVYLLAWGGYRWREENAEVEQKPGDEWLLYLAAGGSRGPFHWKVALDGLFGQPPIRTRFDLSLENDKRQLVQLIPSLGWSVGPGVLKVGGRVPVHGRNFPAGAIGTVSYFLSWDDPLW